MTTWDGSAHTWVSEEMTSSLLNAHVRDPLLSIGGAWNLYTPTWTQATSNPTAGNSNLEGKYLQVGKLVIFQIVLVVGSTASLGTGQFTFSLPTAASASVLQLAMAELGDNSASAVYRAVARIATGGTTCILSCDPTTAGNQLRNVTETVPFTWAVNDRASINGTYESA